MAKEFLAMMIIAEFDNIFFLEYPDSNLLKSIILQHNQKKYSLFKIRTTTSKDCYLSEQLGSELNKLKPL